MSIQDVHIVDFYFRNKAAVYLVAFSLFCIVSLSIQSSPVTITFEGVTSTLLMPFQKGYHNVQKGVHMLWAGFTELGEVRDELKKTREKLQRFEGMSEEVYEIKSENARLRRLLEMRDRVTYDSVPALIISKDPDNWFRTILINRGSNDGIKVNMPVIAFAGDEKAVVGEVIEVRGSVSRVAPVISPDVKVGAMFQESRFPGLLSGYSPNSSLCVIDYVSKSVFIKFGDIIVTSGEGGVFPPGILVGKVIKTMQLDSTAFQRALVRPYVDYNEIEEVYVIKKDTDADIMKLLEGEE